MTLAEKANLSLAAASTFQTTDGIPMEDWPKVAVLLSIAQAQAMVAIAQALESLAQTMVDRSPQTTPAKDHAHSSPGAYL